MQAVLPHTALQLVVSSSGLVRLHIGFMQGEKPICREEGIRPALMVPACHTGDVLICPSARTTAGHPYRMLALLGHV